MSSLGQSINLWDRSRWIGSGMGRIFAVEGRRMSHCMFVCTKQSAEDVRGTGLSHRGERPKAGRRPTNQAGLRRSPRKPTCGLQRGDPFVGPERQNRHDALPSDRSSLFLLRIQAVGLYLRRSSWPPPDLSPERNSLVTSHNEPRE